MSDTWRQVAEALGERMRHQASACPVANGHPDDPGYWRISDEERANHDRSECAFCRDTDAYRRYLAKVRQPR